MSVVTDIADALVAELNGREFAQPFTAQRLYVPRFELSEMATLHVTVVPKGVVLESAGRGLRQTDVTIDMAVQQRFETDETVELDGLMNLVGEIVEFLHGLRLTDYPSAIWLKTANEPIFAPEHMEQYRQFTSVITLTYRVVA